MKMLNNKLFFFLPLLIVGAWLSYLIGQPAANGPKLAYVHADYLFENYAGSTEAYQDLQTKTAHWSEDLDSLSREYKAVYTTYNSQKVNLEKEQRQALEQQLEQQQSRFESHHAKVEKERQAIDQKMTNAIVTQINAYIRAYAEEEGYDMIFTSGETSNLVYSKETYNITETVLTYINKRYNDE